MISLSRHKSREFNIGSYAAQGEEEMSAQLFTQRRCPGFSAKLFGRDPAEGLE
jgi:hypothetical protein